jgi:hypothetical protein
MGQERLTPGLSRCSRNHSVATASDPSARSRTTRLSLRHVAVGWAEQIRSARSRHTSICSAIAKALGVAIRCQASFLEQLSFKWR